MCGFVGIFNQKGSCSLGAELISMASAIEHRGPDDQGVWVNSECTLGFAHRRLAVHDLTSFGAQPKSSPSGRYVVAFNGEIYNFHNLKADLEKLGFLFEGNSDTEVMLAAFEAWGLDLALEKFVGMFAFSLWDKQEKVFYLVRDRLGEKPLYYGWQNNVLLFGSELKALKKYSDWSGEIDRDALSLYVRHNYVPSPYSIYKGVRKLVPGTYLRVFCEGGQESSELRTYWSIRESCELGKESLIIGSKEEVKLELDNLLTQVIKGQMSSDVPVGAFLSGGIDSSLIVALMQENSIEPVKTFTIGFNEEEFNEAVLAKEVARHLGTDHSEMYVSPQDALNVIPKLPFIYDEPFADSSQIPTFILSQFTRQSVTVALSGDGGDELFCGYSRYFTKLEEWERVRRRSGLFRSAAGFAGAVVPNDLMNKIGTMGGRVLNRSFDSLGDRFKSKAGRVSSVGLQSFYRESISYWSFPSDVVVGEGGGSVTYLSDPSSVQSIDEGLEMLMMLDSGSYLPDDILTKIDRAAMAVSLEGRIPFLDHRVVEFSHRIPIKYNLHNGAGKSVIKELLYRRVPKSLIDRPKSGFAVPIAEWLRGPLRDWAEALIDKDRLEAEGFFRASVVRNKWREHLLGTSDWSFHLWGVLMFQSWLENE